MPSIKRQQITIIKKITLIIMKNILVPTDFSIFAEYAIDAAQSLAEKFNATVYVFHNASLTSYLANLSKADQENHKEVLRIIHNANVLLENTLKKFKGNAHPILRKGNLIKISIK